MSTGSGPTSLEKSLPSSHYYSPEIYEREKKSIFCQEWLCAGREEDLPSNGSLLVLDVVGESILVARTKEGELKAHYNVCRHRGSRLCGNDEKWNVNLRGGLTPAATIRCPYHQWTYALDGTLLSAPFLSEAEGFQQEEFSLYPVGLETWGGFFFVNLSPEQAAAAGRTLFSQLGPAAEKFKRYPLRDLRTARKISYDVATNWKIVMENYNECYHCGPVHPELCDLVPDFKRAGGSNLDWERGIPHRPGAYTFTTTGTTSRSPFSGLNEDEKVRHTAELIYPNLLVSLSCDHVAAFLLWPQGPDRTRVECRFLFHPEEMAKASFDPSDAVDFWDLINRQDWTICERVQVGLKSRVHEFGYYAPMEDLAVDIRRYVDKRLGPPQS
jgi:phenylpropionate dioxygenase-like ring-hydroxylating dioxygenase large terminal subunit